MAEAPSADESRACGRSWSFADLGAEVQEECSLDALAGELCARYGSCFCTPEYFALYRNAPNYNVALLDEPRHVIVFSRTGPTADVLNRQIDIEPEALDRIAAAIFRAMPRIQRIRAEVKFRPEDLTSSLRIVQHADDMVVSLPVDADGYHAMIGRTTRKHLRQYSNQLRRRYPEFELRTLEKQDISRELMDQVVTWTNERVRARGDVSVYEEDPAKAEPVWQLLQEYGLAVCGYMGDELVAGQLLLCVGDDTWIHTVGFDSSYEKVHLGLLMTYFSLLESISRGYRRTHMLFGTPVYKQRLGALPVTAYQVSLYRSQLHKQLFAGEALGMLLRDRNELYWAARHAVKRRLAPRKHAGEPAAQQGASGLPAEQPATEQAPPAQSHDRPRP